MKDFGFSQRIFFKIIFLHGEIFEFPQFFFFLEILFNVMARPQCDTPLVNLDSLSFSLSLP